MTKKTQVYLFILLFSVFVPPVMQPQLENNIQATQHQPSIQSNSRDDIQADQCQVTSTVLDMEKWKPQIEQGT